MTRVGSTASPPSPSKKPEVTARWGSIRSEPLWGYAMVAPAVGLLLLFALVPILQTIWLSFHRHLPIFALHEFVGFGNYALLVQDQRFWASYATTLYFTIVSVFLEVMLGLGIALLLQGTAPGMDTGSLVSKGVGWSRVVMLIPWAIPTVVSARMWEWVYHPEYGLLNYLLARVGVITGPIYWLGSPGWAIHAAIMMDVWKTTPFAALLFLAGLQAIPRELYHAAVIDGASRWATFWHLTLPLLWPVVLIVVAFRSMDAFRVFDSIYVLTSGGPGNSTETLSIYAYKTLFQTLQFGYGSAVTTMMFVMVVVMTGVSALLVRGRVRVT